MRRERFGLFVCGFGSISAGLNLPQGRGEGKEKAESEKSREQLSRHFSFFNDIQFSFLRLHIFCLFKEISFLSLSEGVPFFCHKRKEPKKVALEISGR
jgi:hypothetical protein